MTPRRGLARRKFLQAGCAAAAATFAAPLVLPARALAAQGRPGANERIGVGYIGVGRRGLQLMGLPKEGRIVAVCDLNQPRADAVATRASAGPTTTTARCSTPRTWMP